MKTVTEIIEYLEAEMKEAYDRHEHAQLHDKQAALLHLVRAATIKGILEEIKK